MVDQNDNKPLPVVRVVDIDIPIGSMVLFMIKWTIASIPALILLAVAGAIIAAVGFGTVGGLSAAISRAEAERAAAMSPATTQALVVRVRASSSGWILASDSDRTWSDCALSIAGHTARVTLLPSGHEIRVDGSAFSGGAPDATSGDVALVCAVPERVTARIYQFQ